MAALVFLAEAATLGFFALFCAALWGAQSEGRVFETPADPVGRVLIRAVQVAFVLGYGGFFAFSIAQIIAA